MLSKYTKKKKKKACVEITASLEFCHRLLYQSVDVKKKKKTHTILLPNFTAIFP